MEEITTYKFWKDMKVSKFYFWVEYPRNGLCGDLMGIDLNIREVWLNALPKERPRSRSNCKIELLLCVSVGHLVS